MTFLIIYALGFVISLLLSIYAVEREHKEYQLSGVPDYVTLLTYAFSSWLGVLIMVLIFLLYKFQ